MVITLTTWPIALCTRSQLKRWGNDGDLVQLGDDRPRGMRPGHALAVVEEATGAKPVVDRGAQCSKVSVGACRGEPHRTLEVAVALGRRAITSTNCALSSRTMTCSIGVSAEGPMKCPSPTVSGLTGARASIHDPAIPAWP